MRGVSFSLSMECIVHECGRALCWRERERKKEGEREREKEKEIEREREREKAEERLRKIKRER